MLCNDIGPASSTWDCGSKAMKIMQRRQKAEPGRQRLGDSERNAIATPHSPSPELWVGPSQHKWYSLSYHPVPHHLRELPLLVTYRPPSLTPQAHLPGPHSFSPCTALQAAPLPKVPRLILDLHLQVFLSSTSPAGLFSSAAYYLDDSPWECEWSVACHEFA